MCIIYIYVVEYHSTYGIQLYTYFIFIYVYPYYTHVSILYTCIIYTVILLGRWMDGWMDR